MSRLHSLFRHRFSERGALVAVVGHDTKHVPSRDAERRGGASVADEHHTGLVSVGGDGFDLERSSRAR